MNETIAKRKQLLEEIVVGAVGASICISLTMFAGWINYTNDGWNFLMEHQLVWA